MTYTLNAHFLKPATQRVNFLIVLFAISCANLITNSSAQATEAARKSPITVKKTAEAAFSDGLNCLKFADLPCAQLALVNIPSQSANAKVLSGGIAILQGDDDLAFRLLLPLDADNTLQPAARASLHASLSLAYEKMPDMQRAIEQKVLQEQVLVASNAVPLAIQQVQTKLWSLIISLSKDQLIELRGSSAETNLQGWIDLALTQQNIASIADWQQAYPDHSANAFAMSLLQTTPIVSKNIGKQPLQGKIALLLPQSDEKQASTSLAIKSGFKASAAIDHNSVEINIYTISSNELNSDDITSTYDLAMNDGANYILVLSPKSISIKHPFTVPTLLLNAPTTISISKTLPTKNQYVFMQPMTDEAALLAKTAHEFGIQTVLIVSQDSIAADDMSAAFNQAWQQTGGQVSKQIKIADNSNLLDIKAQISVQQTDLIFIAGDAVFARKIRSYLDIATPTFGFSAIYEGSANSTFDGSLNAIRFADLPWLLKPTDFRAYQAYALEIAQDLAAQRYFAMGADSYQILTNLNQQPIVSTDLNGLTGRIHINEQGEITREPSLGSFTNNGVILEK